MSKYTFTREAIEGSFKHMQVALMNDFINLHNKISLLNRQRDERGSLSKVEEALFDKYTHEHAACCSTIKTVHIFITMLMDKLSSDEKGQIKSIGIESFKGYLDEGSEWFDEFDKDPVGMIVKTKGIKLDKGRSLINANNLEEAFKQIKQKEAEGMKNVNGVKLSDIKTPDDFKRLFLDKFPG